MTGERPAVADRVEAEAEAAGAGPPSVPAARRKAILVLGMHRCGTSAATRMISLLGADLPSQLMPGLPGNNEMGFWESTEIAALHDELLAAAGSSWDAVSEFPRAWFETEQAEAYRGRLLAVLERDFAASTLFVVKDPRACRLVPLWVATLSAFGAEPSFVIPLRNPLEVAASLKARDDLAPARSWLLWLGHLLAAEKDTRSYRRSLIAFDELLSDWRAVAARVSEDLDIPWPRQGQRATTEIDDFLSPRYRHHRFGSRELAERPDVPNWVKRAWAAVSGPGKGEEVDTRALDRLRSELRVAERTFGPIVVADRLQLAARRQEIERLEGELAGRSQEIEGLADELAARSREIERLEGELAAQSQEMESQRLELDRSGWQGEQLRTETARTAAELTAREREVDKLRGKLAERGAEIERLASERVERKQLATRLEELATEQRQTVEELQRSASTMQEAARLRRAEEVARLEGEVARLEGEVARLDKEVERLDKEVARLEARGGRRNEHLERLRAEAVRRDEDLKRLETEVARRDELLSRLREKAESRANELAARDRELAGQRAERRQLQSALSEREARIASLESELVGLRRELELRAEELSTALAGAAATSDQLATQQRRMLEHEHEERRVLMQILQAADPGAE